MPDHDNPAHDPFTRHRVQCAGVELSYVDTGADAGADAVVFLHGNPTCAYLWRNVIPHVWRHWPAAWHPTWWVWATQERLRMALTGLLITAVTWMPGLTP